VSSFSSYLGNLPDLVGRAVALRALAALAAAGAWDAAPTEVPCPEFEEVTLFLAYTRGGAGGAVDFQIEVSPYSADVAGVQSWFTLAAYQAGALAAGADVASNAQREAITYTATGAAAEGWVHGTLRLGRTVERLRVAARESGAVATPGTLEITARFG
jgi:hypothetical protein